MAQAAGAQGGEGLASASADAAEAAAVEAVPAEAEAVAVEADTTVGTLVKARGEALVRQSGLTYFILRPAKLSDEAGGFARLEFSQDRIDSRRSVSRADLAEVVVRSLLDPRACNLACTLSDSAYAGEIAGQEDVSKLLEPLRPNYL